ncbi:MAG TPA: hypothetical protein VF385_00780 [Patescibacteria group bacterium]
MKNKIKPFIQRLIKENIYYIIGNIFIFALIIIAIKIGLTESSSYNEKIKTLKTELGPLQNEVNLMQTTIPSSDKLDEDLKFLNTLIPNAEDYFSIIYSLEKLSQKTNFIITSYSVNVGNSTSETLRLSVTGTGDSQSFIEFLKRYNFEGDRLITSDKIKLDPNFSGSLTIDLTFYTKKTEANNKLDMSANSNIYKELETLKTKINFNFNNSVATSSADLNYPKKTNPF